MFYIVLFEPEIPPNTGNIIRLCANMGCHLHLIRPLGFSMDDKHLRRAGLDYHQYACVRKHENFDAFLENKRPKRLFAIETCGEKRYTDAQFKAGDALIFGSETRGLPKQLLSKIPKAQVLYIPMLPNIRSINLSNAVAIVAFEAWRQNDFLA